jgi:hypothetical protein
MPAHPEQHQEVTSFRAVVMDLQGCDVQGVKGKMVLYRSVDTNGSSGQCLLSADQDFGVGSPIRVTERITPDVAESQICIEPRFEPQEYQVFQSGD